MHHLKIVVTGVECSGKTTLCRQLAHHFNTSYVPELARTYLEQINRPYTEADLRVIASEQHIIQQKHLSEHHISICDTDAAVIKIWSEVKYGQFDITIDRLFQDNPPDLYILPHFDIPYVTDQLRESPDKTTRQSLFEKYMRLHISHNTPLLVVRGSEEERLYECVAYINTLL